MNPRLGSLVARNRFGLLLVILVLFLLMLPVSSLPRTDSARVVPHVLEVLLFITVLIAAVGSITKTSVGRTFAVVLGLPAAVLSFLTRVFSSDAFEIVRYGFAAAALGYAVFEILKFVFTRQRVTADTVCASLCVYLLLGVVWAVAYSAVAVLNPAAFVLALPGAGSTAEMRFGRGDSINSLYFSLATLTTLGYGDIVPISPTARVLATLEAIMGQLYLTVLVARLVGLNIVRSDGDRRIPGPA